jgi:methylmalonyl-CoA mutase cobalamin-binding domain/chain
VEEGRRALGRIAEAMGNIDKTTVIQLIEQNIKSNVDPIQILDELRAGLEIVGEKYEKGQYFLLHLMYGAEIFKDGAALLMPKIKQAQVELKKKAKVLIGTVKGDIHDIGKNIVIALLESKGFDVKDLGVDVPPERFVEEVREFKPTVVGMSGLLTASVDFMSSTIEAIAAAGLREGIKVIAGGGMVAEVWVEGKTGADAVAQSAVDGVKTIESFCA